jgi:hypothetical protein
MYMPRLNATVKNKYMTNPLEQMIKNVLWTPSASTPPVIMVIMIISGRRKIVKHIDG